MTATPWVADALCQEVDADLWFAQTGARGGAKGRAETRAAINICRQGPVQTACLEYALVHDIAYGVWGGLSAQDRDRLATGTAA